MAHSRQVEMARNLRLYPWFKFFQGLYFWHAVWFLYFQSELSAAEAVLLYAIYDVGALALEVPSGYMSDRLGRRVTLIAAAASGLAGAMLLVVLAADASRMSKSEVERIWVPFVPWLTLTVALLPPRWRSPALLAQVVTALAVQHLAYTTW